MPPLRVRCARVDGSRALCSRNQTSPRWRASMSRTARPDLCPSRNAYERTRIGTPQILRCRQIVRRGCFKAHPHMLRHACDYTLANKGHDTSVAQLRTTAVTESCKTRGNRNLEASRSGWCSQFKRLGPLTLAALGAPQRAISVVAMPSSLVVQKSSKWRYSTSGGRGSAGLGGRKDVVHCRARECHRSCGWRPAASRGYGGPGKTEPTPARPFFT